MAANTVSQIPPFTQVAAGQHSFAVTGPVVVARGNKDLTLTMGTTWSYITPCRLADMVTVIPDILDYQVEFFLTDLNGLTLLYYNLTSNYLAIIDTIDARVQVFIPTPVQVANNLVAGNYFHMLRVTAPDGTVLVQTKGRVAVSPLATALPTPVDNDPYALSPDATVTAGTTPTAGSAGGTVSTAVFPFNTATLVWSVSHNLGSYPSIITVDSTGTRIWGEEAYIDSNNLTITFANPEVGIVYLN